MDDFRKEVKEALEGEGKKMEFRIGTEALDYLVRKGRKIDKEYCLKVLEGIRQVEYLFVKWANDGLT